MTLVSSSPEPVTRPCSALAYDRGAQARDGVSPQQQLVDRLARKNWHTCRAPALHSCKRCGLALCTDHLPAEDRRCRICEQEFFIVGRRGNWVLIGLYALLVFVAGGVAAMVGYRWGLAAALGAMALAPSISRLGSSTRWRRKRFLHERRPRAALPEARLRDG
jgi:hypothetical protein